MRNYIDFLGESSQDQVLRKEAPDGMTKCIGPMGAIAVKPNGAVGTHGDHAVGERRQYKRPGYFVQQEVCKKGSKANGR